MKFVDIIVIIILSICVLFALLSMKRNHCHDCKHCHKKCGGNNNGREFRKTFKN